MENKIGEKIIVIICIWIVFIVIVAAILSNKETYSPVTENTECEHEFVVTSKYDWWWRSYKTFSKCVKCGLEV